ncbi:D-2-hydroxyacid dehydrogenase [Persicirhabdus sediminis]|uniref:D-2-hydroxyacid dehydrogenase n=1 Tax=Persicirhabdus sediminis TaxID=454144 RepID=A0A8J7MCL4_9BACT|nr:D-2-hydroxyacid dehydrogenase [Persicirhabdus sediminis]MBK1790847.1 D-2-hydroxyacid dehydrogenase [Persicirhabdus sediminis]
MMKIAFLDSCTLHRGELDLSPLEALAEMVYYELTPAELIAERVAGMDAVITNKVPMTRETMEANPQLKLIQACATGVNLIDLEAASELGITVCNVSGYSTAGVAQHVFTLLLNLVTNIHRYAAEISSWPAEKMFCRLDYPVHDLAGKTMGIVGMGAIAEQVAVIAEAFGMKVQVLARDGSSNARRGDLARVDRETFFASSDVVSLHCPLTSETEHFINAEVLSLMKPSAYLINTGRGPLVDEVALLEALEAGEIGGAGLDVLAQEPPAKENALLKYAAGNLLITPHTAWTSVEARQRLLDGMVANVQNFQLGAPSNKVN